MNHQGGIIVTIFREIVQAFLIEDIERIQRKSESFDNGFINRVREMTFWPSRNRDLSEKKRTRLSGLITEITELPQTTDSETQANLLELILTCSHELLAICTEKRYVTGLTEIALGNLQAFVNAAKEKICNDLQLDNVITNDDLITKVKCCCAKACVRSVYVKHCLETNEQLDSRKEKIILDAIKFATAITETLNAAQTTQSKSLLTMDQYIHLLVERAEFVQEGVKKIDAHASNLYVIKYMNDAIQLLNPSAPKAATAIATATEGPEGPEKFQPAKRGFA